jgi:tetratricopeptide (TPR) repeat protein
MTVTGQRAARSALDTARAIIDRLDSAANPEDVAAGLIEAWDSVQESLQALAGTTSLTGQPLLRELRQRDLLSLSEAHALIDFGALAERARAPNYVPTARDRDAARAAVDELSRVVDRGGPAAPSRQTAAASAPPPVEPVTPVATAAHRPNLLGRLVVAAAVLVLVAAAGWGVWSMMREPGDLKRGRAAYAAGDRVTARSAFSAAAGNHPELAEPHIYLGRIARETGDMVTANEELRRAVTLEPANYLTHREMAALLLATRRPDLARSFYERAIRLKPDDQTSLGYMGCTLLQLGRPDLAQRFLARAGAGPWNACVPVPLAPAMPPAAPPQ